MRARIFRRVQAKIPEEKPCIVPDSVILYEKFNCFSERRWTMGKSARLGRRMDVDMTEGNVFMHLLRFALPLLAGNIFQQLYNTVDTWVVGNYVSNEAFSAVGTVSPITNMLIGAFTGLASGAGVVISQYYGAKNNDRVQEAVHTAMMMTLILSIVFTGIGLAMTPMMLRLMKTPVEVMPQSRTYLTIYFGGMIGMLFYNMGAGVLRAVGDSKRPFYYLVVAAVTNTLLDLLFVIRFHMGVAGVAYATIIAQALSAVLTIGKLARSESCVKVQLRKLKIYWPMMKKILRVGIPSALQMAVTSFSNVFVQSYVNQFGANCMGGWTAYNKLDQLILMPMQSVALASTTFVGQNLGVGNVKRAKHGVRTAFIMAIIVSAVLSVVVIWFAPILVAFFNSKTEVISYGTLFIRWLTPFYCICCANQIYSSALRGAGDTRTPMFIMLGSFVLFRQLYLYVMSNFISNTIVPIALAYPAGWLLCSTLTVIHYSRTDLEKTRVVAKGEVREADAE